MHDLAIEWLDSPINGVLDGRYVPGEQLR